MGSRSNHVVLAAIAAIGIGWAGQALATPVINSAVLNFRIFNDDPDSNITFTNNYPASVGIRDSNLDGDGAGGEFANRHNFRLSSNGVTAAVFNNDDGFSLFADMTITGTANSEGGLNIAPWWSQDVDGVFTAITGNGEIAAFGGRLPFYSFNNHVPAVNYTLGETIRLGVNYRPHGLNQQNPATIEYIVIKNNIEYSSGPIAFDEGNPGEGFGSWGMLDNARVGGYFQPQINTNDPDNFGEINFANISFVPEPASLLMLTLGGMLVAGRRRR